MSNLLCAQSGTITGFAFRTSVTDDSYEKGEKEMKPLKLGFLLGTALAAILVFTSTPSIGSQKYANETKKKCLDCHTKVPKKGDTDPPD